MRGKLWITVIVALAAAPGPLASSVVEEYLERYFRTYPSAATAAGRHDLDAALENLGPRQLAAWARFNRDTICRLSVELEDPDLDVEERRDYELLLQEAERRVFDLEVLRRPQRDPLFWSGLLSNATVFLLVRDDRPLEDRLAAAIARADQLPRLADQARQALAATEPSRIAPELCTLAARQVQATARFYREGFSQAAGPKHSELQARLAGAGATASQALEALAVYLEELAGRASGSVRLGERYGDRFRLVTGIEEPVESILAAAERDLQLKLAETAAFGHGLWPTVFPEEQSPESDRELIRRLFERLSADRARTTEEFLEDYRDLVDRSVAFVRQREIITLPEPLTLHLDRSPPYFVGQSVGGVYPAGPYAPETAKTLLFLPTPPDEATAEQRDAFFRDFNHHFNVMITPHELIPGHYLQLKYAARHPRRVRALFGDGVYIEGWGTFCERLMLDLGWGDPLDRLAHLKKQLENIARTIVDIRVHTQGMSREEVLAFVQQEALQDQQFAANMWTRAITSSPQLTFYYLGYREVWKLFEDVQRTRGDGFQLKAFMDGMMALGPVSLEHYRREMLPASTPQGSR